MQPACSHTQALTTTAQHNTAQHSKTLKSLQSETAAALPAIAEHLDSRQQISPNATAKKVDIISTCSSFLHADPQVRHAASCEGGFHVAAHGMLLVAVGRRGLINTSAQWMVLPEPHETNCSSTHW
jgi:hypothetical protein